MATDTSAPDRFAEYAEYCRLRLDGDPHLWATTLFDEVTALGYQGSYPASTRALREQTLRPVCAACMQTRSRDRSVVEHPSGDETNGTGWNCPIHRPDGVGATRLKC